MTDELNLETTPEEELEDLPELEELDELCELDGAEEEALEEAEEEAEEAPKKCYCGNKRKLALIGGIALGLAIAAIIALIFANRAKKD